MFWIALLPSDEGQRTAWSWWGLRFTPRVAQVDEALLLELSGSLRLWGGRRALLQQLLQGQPELAGADWAQGPTSLIALGLLRQKMAGRPMPPQARRLPLDTLTAAREHIEPLARAGCRTWGELEALPRGGVSRRFGAPLLAALDGAMGRQPERYPWLTLPELFDQKLELPALATSAPELMWSAARLLAQLQVWLQARQLGVLAFELEWTLDLKRLDGARLPSHERLVIRTAQPAQDMAHLRKLASEHLDRASIAAPANHLRLRSLETTAWGGASRSLLAEDQARGDKLHQLVERLSARLGPEQVLVPQANADHRPEHRQHWVPAQQQLPVDVSPAPRRKGKARAAPPSDAIHPPWLLPQPLRLAVQRDTPQYHGPLRLLTRPQRIEAGWWDEEGKGLALRDYFIARSPAVGLVWIYRERPASLADSEAQPAQARWYLQGLYA
ncbi:DNA polymerase Y family protein [Caenimonas terrae]|uniref:DNA polymerase Y family protein n=1 Tax=Caenimonas terrae TaxID=696074 RepID=A0ABW0NF89_9BURK